MARAGGRCGAHCDTECSGSLRARVRTSSRKRLWVSSMLGSQCAGNAASAVRLSHRTRRCVVSHTQSGYKGCCMIIVHFIVTNFYILYSLVLPFLVLCHKCRNGKDKTGHCAVSLVILHAYYISTLIYCRSP